MMSDPKPTRAKKAPSTPRSPSKKATRSTRATRTRVSPEAVAEKAYERYAERGYVHGHDMEDWFVAERELSAGKARGRKKEG